MSSCCTDKARGERDGRGKEGREGKGGKGGGKGRGEGTGLNLPVEGEGRRVEGWEEGGGGGRGRREGKNIRPGTPLKSNHITPHCTLHQNYGSALWNLLLWAMLLNLVFSCG